VGKLTTDSLVPALPQSAELEKAILGAILAGHKQRAELVDTLRAEDFFGEWHRKIFLAVLALQNEGQSPDLLSVHDVLERGATLAEIGGIAYLASLGDGVPLAGDMLHSARKLREKSVYRQAIHVADSIQQLAFEQADTPAQFLDVAIERLSALARDMESAEDDGVTHFDAARRALMELDEDAGTKIYTDVDKLDKIIGGFRKGELIILTAETGSGKTLFAQQIRARACRDGFHSLYCSAEMFASHLKRRELAAAADVPPLKMRHEERLSSEDRRALLEAAGHECKRCRILDGELEISRIRRASRKMKKLSGLDLLILDYDELIEAPGKTDLEQQTNLVRNAKSIGMELHCPVILISQLRKPLSGEDAARATLARIYGSGSKTKHASFVILADRPFVRELQGDEKEAQLFILKGRDSQTGRIKATFNIRKLRFDDAHEEECTDAWRNPAEPRECED
jgi:replicative DNA helicase